MLDRVAERLIYLAGAASQRGDGRRPSAGLLHYLAAAAGLEDARRGELPRRARTAPRSIRPRRHRRPARPTRCGPSRRSSGGTGATSASAAGCTCSAGASAGPLLFEAAGRLLEVDASWRGAFGAIVTLLEPDSRLRRRRRCSSSATSRPALAGRQLCERAADPAHRAWVVLGRRAAARDRRRRLLTLGAADDAVVTPSDSIVRRAGRVARSLRAAPGAAARRRLQERRLGHGAILNDPTAWRLTLAAIQG